MTNKFSILYQTAGTHLYSQICGFLESEASRFEEEGRKYLQATHYCAFFSCEMIMLPFALKLFRRTIKYL